MTTVTPELTVRKTVTVARTIDDAFALFTEQMGTWWPMETHSIGGAQAAVIFEPRQGGRVYEREANGRINDWATVVSYEPPHRFVLEWKVGTDQPPYTEVEARFTAAGAATSVELEHRGWERLAPQQRRDRAASYDAGWAHVIGRYEDAAAAHA